MAKQSHIFWLKNIDPQDVGRVGNRAATLAHVYQQYKDVRIPRGFVIDTTVFAHVLQDTNIQECINTQVLTLHNASDAEYEKVSKKMQKLVFRASIPKDVEMHIARAYNSLTKKKSSHVMVRASVDDRRLPEQYNHNVHPGIVYVETITDLETAIRQMIAGWFSVDAIKYREQQGFAHDSCCMAILVQQMIDTDTGACGDAVSVDPESGFEKIVTVRSCYGARCHSDIDADRFWIGKYAAEQSLYPVIGKRIGEKAEMYTRHGIGKEKKKRVPKRRSQLFAITDAQAIQAGTAAILLERVYMKPVRVSWVTSGVSEHIFVIDIEPVVDITSRQLNMFHHQMNTTAEPICIGTTATFGVAVGKVNVWNSEDNWTVVPGDIVVADDIDATMLKDLVHAGGLAIGNTSILSPVAHFAREHGIVCILGVDTSVVSTEKYLTLSATHTNGGKIYSGKHPYELVPHRDSPRTKTKVLINVDHPDQALRIGSSSHDGIGIARIERVVTEDIGIHPMALVVFDKVKGMHVRRQIRKMTAGYTDKRAYYTDRIAEAVGKIALSVYPKSAVVQFNDATSTVFRELIAGDQFESEEVNPMIGWRGASRYYSDEYAPAFAAACEAIRRVRTDWGLDNVIPLVPFCRTPEEGRKVLDAMASYGLVQGEHGLKVYVLCQIPSNVILAEEFADMFDGIAIGTNDLTQLILGVDHDNDMVGKLYNDEHPAIQSFIKHISKVAKKHKLPVTVCGEAPSLLEGFTDYLVRKRISGISFQPHMIAPMKSHIAYNEQTVGRMGKKTHVPILTSVAVYGLAAIALLGAGVGCSTQKDTHILPSVNSPSPAEVRERVMNQVSEGLGKKQAAQRTTFSDQSFIPFSLTYPVTWKVNHWDKGVTLMDPQSDQYISVFQQVLAHPVSDEQKKTILISGVEAKRFHVTDQNIHVVEIPVGEDVLEINGRSDTFEDMLTSFTLDESSIPDRPLNEWDIRDKRFCIQVITYARKGEGECTAYPTPCDVPKGWDVCTPSE